MSAGEARTGKVWLVGAGPGDPRLLTLAAWEALDAADTVIHDRLVSGEILRALGPGARLIDVGKAPGRHPVPQEEIHRLLIAEARQGRRVARLKGGDPFLFGRGGEEALALRAAGVPWEIIPGLSSALAVPALAGIPVTHRGESSSLHVITWRGKGGGPPAPEVLKNLAGAGGTLVILMGGSALPEIGESLGAAGFPPETPAAIIENGASPRQRRWLLTLRELARFPGFGPVPAAAPADQAPPAPGPVLVAVGRVCALGETLGDGAILPRPDPPGDLPLAGLRIVVTHSEPRNAELCRQVRAQGGRAIPFPCVKTRAAPGLCAEDFREAGSCQWLAFTSAAGVEFFFQGCRKTAVDQRTFGNCRFAALGPATAASLRDRGFIPDLEAPVFNGRALGESLAERLKPSEKVFLPRSRQASPALTRVLRDRGIPFRELPVYETLPAEGNSPARGLIAAGAFDLVFFSSPSAVSAFKSIFGAAPSPDFSRLKALCIGESTAGQAHREGMRVFVAAEATASGLCQLAAELGRGSAEGA